MKSCTISQSSRILFLDYLRVFAFLSVLVGHKFYGDLEHLSQKPWLHATARQILQGTLPFFHGGGAGVIVFFLVSGYVISWSLFQKSETCSSFLIKRFFRIYPIYVLAVVVQAVVNGGGGGPSLKTLSLFGDFWGTPYALGGVEWTLRLEILFYLLMAIFHFCGLFQLRRKYLPLILFLFLPILSVSSPFPNQTWLFVSYTTTYAPFLLLGVMVLLFEKHVIRVNTLFFFIGLVLVQYFYSIAKYQPRWLSTHFVSYGLALFFLAWKLRGAFLPSPMILVLSHLTYSIYLFHNWLFDIFYGFLVGQEIRLWQAKLLALVPLFTVCTLAFYLVERPAIRLGSRLLRIMKKGFRVQEVSSVS